MNFISIETITNICSVSLFSNNKIVDTIENSDDLMHSKNLPLLFNELINKNNFNLKDLSFIAISIGPGSYTGIKVGVNFTKGLAYSLNIPVVPVNSFDSLNYLIDNNERYYIALYSHKEHIYYQDFKDGVSQSEQICNKVSVLKKYEIYGYHLDKLDSIISYNETIPSSYSVGLFAIDNYEKLATKEYDSILSICIPKVNKYV